MKKIQFALLSLILGAAQANAQFVVFSGGGNPAGNHYSQYLQTKSLADGLREKFGASNVDVAFGVGNRPDQTPIIADVHRSFTQEIEGKVRNVDTMIVGNIFENRQANPNSLANMLVEQSKNNAPLFLLVSDHGAPNETAKNEIQDYKDNCIDTWAMNIETRTMLSWSERCLSRKELEASLVKTSASKVVYGMSQCFSGGFHYMTVKSDPTGYVSVNPNLCGFTATVPDLTASGCSPLVDGPNYAGYERFFTKNIIGKDFITQEPTAAGPAKSLYQAHQLAAIDDFTNDIPISSSEFYLSEVAKNFKSNPAAPNFLRSYDSASISSLIANYSQVVSGAIAHPLYEAQVNQIKAVAETLAKKFTPTNDLVFKTSYSDLSAKLNTLTASRENLGQKSDDLDTETSKLEADLQFGLWMNLVMNPQTRSSLGMSTIEQEFEYDMLKRFGADLTRRAAIAGELSYLSVSNPSKAAEFAVYLAIRDKRVWNYIYNLTDATNKQKTAQLDALYTELDSVGKNLEQVDNEYRYTRRILMMREQLGVLGAAIQTSSSEILKNYSALLSCEQTRM